MSWCLITAADRRTNSTASRTLPPPLTAVIPRPQTSPSPPPPPSNASGCSSPLRGSLSLPPVTSRRLVESAFDTYIPLDECYSGSRPVTHYPRSANASPQVCVRGRPVRTKSHQNESIFRSNRTKISVLMGVRSDGIFVLTGIRSNGISLE